MIVILQMKQQHILQILIIGIITRGETDNCLNLLEQDLNKMTYDELSHNRNNLLNLKDEIFLFEFLKTI